MAEIPQRLRAKYSFLCCVVHSSPQRSSSPMTCRETSPHLLRRKNFQLRLCNVFGNFIYSRDSNFARISQVTLKCYFRSRERNRKPWARARFQRNGCLAWKTQVFCVISDAPSSDSSRFQTLRRLINASAVNGQNSLTRTLYLSRRFSKFDKKTWMSLKVSLKVM